MAITQKDMIHSLSKLLDWLEQEKNWETNAGELRFITGRIGELYTAIMTNGQMATETNQEGYDVVSENNEHISVKTTTQKNSHYHFKFNARTLNRVHRIVLVYVNVEDVEIEILYDAPLKEAEKLMRDANDGKDKVIYQSKILKKETNQIVDAIVSNEVHYKDYSIQKLESGTIKINEKGEAVSVVKPILREIAKEININLTNNNGNLRTTRELGNDIIRQLTK